LNKAVFDSRQSFSKERLSEGPDLLDLAIFDRHPPDAGGSVLTSAFKEFPVVNQQALGEGPGVVGEFSQNFDSQSLNLRGSATGRMGNQRNQQHLKPESGFPNGSQSSLRLMES
jgi:hypothetical protein